MKNKKVYITDVLFERSRRLLRSFAPSGSKATEGVVYWFGFETPVASIVTTLLVPDADVSWGCISTSAVANAQVLTSVVGTPLVLIGQAHSHPGSDVRHSDVDDRQTFPRFEGAISVVVPCFARRKFDLGKCGVHRFAGGQYGLVPGEKVPDHLVVLPGERDFRR
jgi:hypothetical protein